MNNSPQKLCTALQIEYHWWRIRRLRRQPGSSRIEEHIALHRYRAAQLASWYEVLAGIRDTAGHVIG